MTTKMEITGLCLRKRKKEQQCLKNGNNIKIKMMSYKNESFPCVGCWRLSVIIKWTNLMCVFANNWRWREMRWDMGFVC